MRLIALPTVAALIAAACVAVHPATGPGPRSDGAVVLHDGWTIRPLGRAIDVGTFPMAVAPLPGGRAAVLLCGFAGEGIDVVDLSRGTRRRLPMPKAWLGLAASADGKTLYASGGADNVVRVFEEGPGGCTPRGRVDSRPYSTASVLRTLETIFGLPPLSQYDEAAPLLAFEFSGPFDGTPFSTVTPRVPLDLRNPVAAPPNGSAELDFRRPDTVPETVLNDVLYRAVQGRPSPGITVRYGSATPRGDEDGD